MTVDETVARTPRRRDSQASRQDLLNAARDLFAARGYERTTLREIGDRAGVDPALVARYFGSKAALYSAAIDADNEAAGAAALTDLEGVVELALRRVDEKGVGPLMQSLMHPQADDDTRSVASGHLRRRLVEPLVREQVDAGVEESAATVRAEAAVAAVLGIASVRGLGGFGALTGADRDELIALVTSGLSGLIAP